MKGEIELYNISFLILKVELHFKPWQMGAQQELSNEYQHDRV